MSTNRIRVPLAALATVALLAGCGGAGPTTPPEGGEAATTTDSTTDPVTGGEATGSTDARTTEGAETETTKSTEGTGAAPDGGQVRLVTHESFSLPEELIAQFEEESGYELVIVQPGDAGAMVSQLVLTQASPLGDAVFGIDNTFASRAVDAGVLAPYTSPHAVSALPDFEGHLTAIDQGDVCLNVDHQWFTDEGLAEPTSFEDLLEPEYQGLTVVTNPATSSPGLAFLFATIGHFGEDGWQQYWTDLLANDTRVADGWSDAYYVDFTPYGGDHPIVLSYSSSPSAEMGEDGTARTGNVESTCFRQIEFAGVLEGADNPEGAQALVDWLLSAEVQEAFPENMYMYPASPDAELPEEWARWATLSETPVDLDPAQIAENRDRWMQEWLALVG